MKKDFLINVMRYCLKNNDGHSFIQVLKLSWAVVEMTNDLEADDRNQSVRQELWLAYNYYFAHEITKAALSPYLFKNTLSVGQVRI